MRTLLVVIAVLIAAGSFGADLVGRSSNWWLWLKLGALALLVLQGVLASLAVRQARRAESDYKILVYDQLTPFAQRLSVLATANTQERRMKLGETLQVGVSSAIALTTAKRLRATLFRVKLQEGGSRSFVPGPSAGRGDPAQSTFVEGVGSEEGDAVWQAAEANEPRFCPDVRKDPPPGWDPAKVRVYRTFITVPVRTGDDALEGLLTINAPKPGDLSEHDVRTMQLLAALIGVAIGMCPSS